MKIKDATGVSDIRVSSGRLSSTNDNWSKNGAAHRIVQFTLEELLTKNKVSWNIFVFFVFVQEVVQRFLSQGDTQKHLEQLKNDNEKMLIRLKEEKVKIGS